jgi:copper oxidase (laccase) domain-containing protein
MPKSKLCVACEFPQASGMKKCTICKEEKPLYSFRRDRARNKQISQCVLCFDARQKERRLNLPRFYPV